MPGYWLSAHHHSDQFPPPWSPETKVELFVAQIRWWILEPAQLMAEGGLSAGAMRPPFEHASFAILAVCLPYFEMIGKYSSGSTSIGSEDGFNLGFKAVYEWATPEGHRVDEDLFARVLRVIYGKARCGLAHVAAAHAGVEVRDDEGPLIARSEHGVALRPRQLPRLLCHHLDWYESALADPARPGLLSAFLSRFDHDRRPPTDVEAQDLRVLAAEMPETGPPAGGGSVTIAPSGTMLRKP